MAPNLNFSHPKKMLLAVKDHLKIQVSVLDKKVNIELHDMDEVLILWESWIRQEERLAEIHLSNQASHNPYPALEDYFTERGWRIENMS